MACNTSLESSQQGLQLRFRPHPDRRSAQEVIVPQSRGISNLGDFKTPTLGVPGQKNHLDEGTVERCRVYYMGEGGGFRRVQVMVCVID